MKALNQLMLRFNHTHFRLVTLFLCGLLVLGLGCSRPPEPEKTPDVPREPGAPDVQYVPTPANIVEKMLELAEVKDGDVVYDLGCGDGRIVVTAAKKYGVKAVGFEIDPDLVRKSLENVKENHVEDRVTIREADIFTLDLSEATVVTLYLLPELNVKLMPQLAKMKPGSRIVSHSFPMKGAKPERVEKVHGKVLYRWIVPWQKE